MIEPEVSTQGKVEASTEIDADPKSAGIDETTRRALINARLGQGGYRKRMLKLWRGRCALTGCGIKEILIASHAKAWSACSNSERLDEYNGLLLAASIDKLFDTGLISFTDTGALLCSSRLNQDELHALGIGGSRQLAFVDHRHIPYLKAHRSHHGYIAAAQVRP